MTPGIPPDARLIGKGRQGTVYQIARDRCIKIYKNHRYAQMETDAYRKARSSRFTPKLFESGPDYIVMEYIRGEPLQQYLKDKETITLEISKQLLALIEEMERLGFSRIDAGLSHIIVSGPQDWKWIDLVHCYTKKYKKPLVMLSGLKQIGLLDPFLMHVKELNPLLYEKWKNRHGHKGRAT